MAIFDGSPTKAKNDVFVTRKMFDERFDRTARWEERRGYIFRTCTVTEKLIWPFEKAFVGTATYFGEDKPVKIEKWLNGPTFTYLRLTGKV